MLTKPDLSFKRATQASSTIINSMLKEIQPSKLKFVGVLMAIAGVAFPFAASAQEQQGCFMLGTNGRPIDLSSLCPNGISSQPLTPGLYKVPIKRRAGNTPVIDVTFNGRQTFEMILDTGATTTILTPQMAEILGVKPEGVFLADTPSNTGVAFPSSRVPSVAVGGMTAKDLDVGISPSLDLGLLGQNFFSNYDVTIKQDEIEFRAR